MISINLDLVISAITSVANPLIKEKILRSETVIKLLQQFYLDPEHPPADFSAVYAYALVEYGIGKPKAFLELFRHETIKVAFRKALDHNNPSIVLSEVDAFLNTYSLGDEIRTLGLDVRREVAAFATVFIEVAKRTRTPADVLLNQRIGSLHQRIATITEQLDRLPTLEGIRTEIARLTAETQPALPLPATATENKCRAIALAQQMRGWFETLGYRFEKYEIWDDSFFEWIINVPVRRNRYDRILVRGIEGEVQLSDVIALQQSTQTQRVDEGWLVTTRRISKAARTETQKPENSHLACYTFDELLAQDADFSSYLDWLESEVKRKKIDTQYVPLACKKEELDPVSKNQIAVSYYDESDGWIDGYIDRWLHDPVKEHISILGEFGTGKTWFALHYAWVSLQRYRDAQKRGVELPRLPLVIPLRDYAKAVSVESLFSEFFFRKHEIPLPGYSAFEQLNRMGKLLLIFDGFDEMAARVDKQEMINNFWELAKVVVPGSKVILTCRTEHFPEAKEGRELLNAELQASTKNLTGETPQFEVLELEKFSDEQIQQVLSYQAELTTVEQVMRNPQLLDLARRPIMTDLILEALPDIEAGRPVDMARVYLYAVRRKMERDIKAERTFTSLADKLYFLCELSWEMLSTNQMSLNYRLFPERIRRLFGSVVQEEKDLDHWHYDMMAQTMLVRNADGDYTPAHRSLLEFFVAYKFAAELGALASDFTELAQAQSCLDINTTPVDYTWSGYFLRQLNDIVAPLKAFTTESFEKLRENFGKAPLTKAVMDLLVPVLSNHESLINVIEATRGRTEDEVGYIGGNAATLAVKVDRAALEKRDLSDAVIKAADFSSASLRDVNFTKANFIDSGFIKDFGAVFSVAYNSDGQFIVTGDGNCIIRLWEVSTGREVLTCKGHTSGILSVNFSSDSKTLVSCSYDGTIKLWNSNNGKCLKTLEGHNSAVNSVVFCPRNKILASGGADTTIRLWDIDTGQCFQILEGHTNSVQSVAFSTDAKMLVSGASDNTVRLWNTQTGKCLKILDEHTKTVRSVAFSPDSHLLASAGYDTTIKLWDIQTGECKLTLQAHNHPIFNISFSPNSKILASSSNQTIKLWDMNTKKCLQIFEGHFNIVRSISFSPDGNSLVSGSYDKTVRFWNIKTGECLKILQGYSNWVNSILFSLDSKNLASADDLAVVIWDISTGESIRTLQGHTHWVQSIAFNQSSMILASGSADHTIILWDFQTGECLKTLRGHRGWVQSVAFNPGNQLLASGSADGTIRLWDVQSGECWKVLHSDYSIRSVAFNLDGKILASGLADGTIRLWNIHTGECLKTWQVGNNVGTRSIAFSLDSQVLASGMSNASVGLWNTSTGECLRSLHGHTDSVLAVALSSDGKILASGGDDQTVRLWDINSGECLQILRGHSLWIRSVAFSSNGSIIASCSCDSTIKLWNVETGECLKTLISRRPYENMNITDVKGLSECEKATLKALGAVEYGRE
ncbi:NACHT domain-containing protein [Nostoc sp. FACHB-280]|uniref:NACHT and WD40 repeat domain-containing protein n=1 Tax=Nostoc sp. FACHB-280 TaxID=2692839 RepID=UPI00168A5B9A|nr:NACHT domain-containing protein [Nostoc sp. FACHB-280]MBD2498824.1 NACHT domain-containing protein [Nostoc sp. FACHB-280]